MNWKIASVLCLVPATLANAACAGRPLSPPRAPGESAGERAVVAPNAMLLTSFDTDADLVVTGVERDAGAAHEFARADSDADGVLSPFEYNAWAQAALGGMHAPRRLEFDSNVDNAITAAEFADALRALMRAYDADDDGRITRAELIRERPQATSPGPAAPRSGRGGGRRPPT